MGMSKGKRGIGAQDIGGKGQRMTQGSRAQDHLCTRAKGFWCWGNLKRGMGSHTKIKAKEVKRPSFSLTKDRKSMGYNPYTRAQGQRAGSEGAYETDTWKKDT